MCCGSFHETFHAECPQWTSSRPLLGETGVVLDAERGEVRVADDVADHAHQHLELDRDEVIVDLKSSIAVAVQNGNSSIISRGLQDSIRNIRTFTSRFR